MKKRTLALHTTLASSIIALGTMTDYRDIMKTRVELKTERTFLELVNRIPDTCDIPIEIPHAILFKESGPKRTAAILRGDIPPMTLKRYEPGHLERYGKKIDSDPEQAREWASSHCPFQVMGWHQKLKLDGTPQNRGSWHKLYEPEECVFQFCTIWNGYKKQEEKKSPNASKWDILFATSRSYNGSDLYAKDFMEKLSRSAIEKL